MAKKRRKEEKEEEFKLPEFDEEAYLRKEITATKLMLIVIFLAMIAAALSYFLTMAGVVVVAFFAGFSLIFLLRYLPSIFGVDTKGFEKKDWLGQATTYFFTWLAIWVLIMNVPFADVTLPSLTVYVNGQQVVSGRDPSAGGKGWAIVTAKVADNAGISGVWITEGSGSPIDMTPQPDGLLWSSNVTVTSIKQITVAAEDISGNAPVSVQFLITP